MAAEAKAAKKEERMAAAREARARDEAERARRKQREEAAREERQKAEQEARAVQAAKDKRNRMIVIAALVLGSILVADFFGCCEVLKADVPWTSKIKDID